MRLAVVLLLAASCIRDPLVPCGDVVCPANTVCFEGSRCATQAQLDACAGRAATTPCTTPSIASGACANDLCEPIVCGDGLVVGPEVCDDGNEISGDGCSADCRSLEVCGNGIVDGSVGEQCDDLPAGLSRDGCSSRCSIEYDFWFDVSPQLPQASGQASMAYDEHRHVTVLVDLGSTWEWDGFSWRKRTSVHSPGARSSPLLAYDSRLGVTIMYGGGSDAAGSDLWAWDGYDWSNITPTDEPAMASTVAYDPAHDLLAIYDGTTTSTWDGVHWTAYVQPAPVPNRGAMVFDPEGPRLILFDADGNTFAWSGTQWSQLTTPAHPTARAEPVLTRTANHVLLQGGSSTGPLNDTWLWSGTAWTLLAPPAWPTPRHSPSSAYDIARDRVVVFGGGTGSPLNDTWEYDGSTWAQRFPNLAPAERNFASAAFAPWTGTLLLWGGQTLASDQDSYEWDGAVWIHRAAPSEVPSTRLAAMMTAMRDRILLFGGALWSGASGLSNETWEWDGTWHQVMTAHAPGPRYFAGMAYDGRRDRVVLFGGMSDTDFLDETWEFDGTDWTQQTPAHVPPAREGAMMAYDARRGVTVLFGGDGVISTYLDDTWEWDGTDWTERTPAISPPGRYVGNAAYDSMRGRVAIFGGQDQYAYRNDYWEWDGTTWTLSTSLTTPPIDYGDTMGFDPVTGQMTILTTDGATWTHVWVAPNQPADLCTDTAIDSDGDGLAGCADPDCWARCTPECPPDAPCDPMAPHCGDGVCSAVEDSRLCPQDCPP